MAATMVEKTGGVKVDLRVSGTKVYLGDDEMVLNLSKYERDDPVHIDIGLNARGFLTFGVSDRYAVQIDIPGRDSYGSLDIQCPLYYAHAAAVRFPGAACHGSGSRCEAAGSRFGTG